MTTESARSKQDEKTLLSIVEEMSRSNNGADSTRHWADGVVWFDIPPFASRGLAVARETFDTELATGALRPPMLVRTTDCFERREGQWKVIHEHLSLPTPAKWDGKIHQAP